MDRIRRHLRSLLVATGLLVLTAGLAVGHELPSAADEGLDTAAEAAAKTGPVRPDPPAAPAVQEAAAKQVKGVSFQLRPIYGVTIPVIVRLGNLQATAGISDVRLEQKDGHRALSLELSRNGESLTVARQNDVLGAWALFDENDPMPVTARTVEDTRLLRIARDDFYDLLSDNSEITSAIFSTLVKRFRKLVEP